MKVSGKRVVITGAASGIGKALAIAFQAADAKSIVCVDQNIAEATIVAETISGYAIEANVGLEKDIIKVID